MFVKIDKVTNKIIQTIDKNYGIQVNENELLQEITDETLINKINSAYEYTLIFNDTKDSIIDINITKTIEQHQQDQLSNIDNIKQQKINEINSACQNAIINTFQSNAYDGTIIEDYACELTDQSRINGLVTIAQLRLANLTTEPINYYKNKEAIKCTEWQPKNMLNLGLDLKRHIEKNTNHYEDLKIYINSLNSVEEVQKVTWDTVIPTQTT
ncbi:hypothetical protein [Clostridium scatologenes]|uniref:DUF4376 domain-containing protein n=1 Tax=Clostridium scatologenes TaxID=1548 RepID=A0A0E3JY37_CLOSL|nr:hypothetical protein [Clostridium scatologenes]AKA68562.1 hypothetical protein CSCA_1437 [Clostridium scatologenes]